jgi:hypothetical protein
VSHRSVIAGSQSAVAVRIPSRNGSPFKLLTLRHFRISLGGGARFIGPTNEQRPIPSCRVSHELKNGKRPGVSGKDYARGIDSVTLVRCGPDSDIAQYFMVCTWWLVARAANYFLSNLNLDHPAVGLFITDNFNAICFHATRMTDRPWAGQARNAVAAKEVRSPAMETRSKMKCRCLKTRKILI